MAYREKTRFTRLLGLPTGVAVAILNDAGKMLFPAKEVESAVKMGLLARTSSPDGDTVLLTALSYWLPHRSSRQGVFWLYGERISSRDIVLAFGANDLTRFLVSTMGPGGAMWYARTVDKGPHPVTRMLASNHPGKALAYALEIDGCPCPETRAGASRATYTALEYATRVDRMPHPATRAAACTSPGAAIDYALEVDRQPNPVADAAVVAIMSDPDAPGPASSKKAKEYLEAFGLDRVDGVARGILEEALTHNPSEEK